MLPSSLVAALLVLAVLPATRGQGPELVTDHVLGRGVSGVPCLTSCAAGGGHCTIAHGSSNIMTERCMVLQYYTSLSLTNTPLCAGPCGRFTDPRTNTCIVNVTAAAVDYCNPRTEHEVVSGALALDGEPCAGPCSADHTCHTATRQATGCSRQTQHYIRAHRVFNGDPCRGRCESRQWNRGLTCHNANGDVRVCAPPARYVMHAADDRPRP